MLPDFPTTKSDVFRQIDRRISELVLEMNPVFGRMGSFTQHEGRMLAYEQVDFGMKTQESQAHQTAFEVRLDEVPHLTGLALDQKLRGIAEQMGAARMKVLYERIDEATKQTGNRYDAGGKPATGEMLLEMFSKGEWGFDKAGKPNMSFVIHPDTYPALKKAADEIENDPELKRRHGEIVARHYEQWLARENRRKLVD